MNNSHEPKLKTFYTNRAVLVTGGAGFIGSHLVEQLVALGADVTVLDNFSTGSYDNLKNVAESICIVQGDITNQQTCMQIVQGKSIVFHLAAWVSVPASVEDPTGCMAINAQGTLNVLEAARSAHADRFVLSSSSAVYGQQEGVCTEMTQCHPGSPYGLSKLVAEQYCRLYGQLYHIPTICLRYFNVYGPRQQAEGAYAAVVAKIIAALKENEPITVFGDGQQTRDFVAVEQVVAANLMLAMLPEHLYAGQPVNIGSGKAITLLELVEQLKQRFPQATSPLLFQPARPGDIRHSQADCTLLSELKEVVGA